MSYGERIMSETKHHLLVAVNFSRFLKRAPRSRKARIRLNTIFVSVSLCRLRRWLTARFGIRLGRILVAKSAHSPCHPGPACETMALQAARSWSGGAAGRAGLCRRKGASMKLRIRGDSIRLRLGESEVAQLVESGRVSEHVRFSAAPGNH